MVFPSGFIPPCQPSKVARPPSGPDWVHEIKHDGYRLMVRRDGLRVRCFTRNGNDWADRFPSIVEAALLIKATSFLIDGEVVITHGFANRLETTRNLIELTRQDIARFEQIIAKHRGSREIGLADSVAATATD